ncbi:MAG: calcium-binding protein, partial [Pseudomonadota bacterium]
MTKKLITTQTKASLTQEEIDLLDQLLMSGDRGGYYMAYHAMTGSDEAVLQAKVATFSGVIGGGAFISNRILQEWHGTGGSGNPGTYPGIYYLSQEVARTSFNAIAEDARDASMGAGVLTEEAFFNTTFEAWQANTNVEYFPGNILLPIGLIGEFLELISLGTLDNPYETDIIGLWDATTSNGALASFMALPYVYYAGKQLSDFTGGGYTQIDGPGGTTLVIDSSGRVTALDQGLFSSAVDQTIIAGITAVSAFALDEFGQNLPTQYAENIQVLTGVHPGTEFDPDSAAFAAARRAFSDFAPGFNGDVNPPQINDERDTPVFVWRAAATGNDDILQGTDSLFSLGGNDTIDAGGGNDVVFGAGGEDMLKGGAGNDILWGQAGEDILEGGEGDDTSRGGAGDDKIIAGAGDDFIDGGDITAPRVSSTFFGLFSSSAADGMDLLDYTELDEKVVVHIRDDAKIAESFDGDLSKIDGSSGVVIKGENGQSGTDVYHSIEAIKLAAHDNIIKHGTVKAGEQDPGYHVLKFELEASASSHTQTIDVLTASGDKGVTDAVIVIDGKQLIGGAAFDFNKFDMRTNDLDSFTSILSGRQYQSVATMDQWQAWKNIEVGGLFDQASELVDTASPVAPPGLPGGGAGISFGLGLFFGILGINEAIRWDNEWVSAYEQVILGWHGERYFLGTENPDGTRTLTITLDPDDVQASQEIVINNWRPGDFGINIKEFSRGNGLETDTNKNAVLDSWSQLSDSFIQGKLASVGFRDPMVDPDEWPVMRHGNAADNVLGGTEDDDVFNGAQGNDTLIGGEGFDQYFFEIGDGQDIIADVSDAGNRITFLGGLNILSDVTQTEVSDGNGGTDLLLEYGTSDSIRILGWGGLTEATQQSWIFEAEDAPDISSSDPALTPDLSVQTPEIIGTDNAETLIGTDTAEFIDARSGNDIVFGYGGDDQILGSFGNDNLDGGLGNDRIIAGRDADEIRGGKGDDFLQGGFGSDDYYFEKGDGADIIDETGGSSTDRLFLGEFISPSDVTITRDFDNPNAVILTIGDWGDSIRVLNQSGSNGLDSVHFFDGTVWSRTDMNRLYLASAVTDGDDEIVSYDA